MRFPLATPHQRATAPHPDATHLILTTTVVYGARP